MQAFTIDNENNISVFASLKEIEESQGITQTFTSSQELAALVDKWPGARLVEIWNSVPGLEPVQRFTSRQVAVTRIWKAVQNLTPAVGARGRQVGPSQRGARNKAARAAGRPAHPDSKNAQVIALLRRPTGASLKALMHATGWQAHSVRGFISGQLGKKMGLCVRSFRRNKERVYAIQS